MSLSTIDMLKTQFAYIHGVVEKNVAGLSQEDSLIRPQPEGNCLNWVLGHLVASRNSTLRALGRETIWTDEQAEPYRRGSDALTDASDATPLDNLLADFRVSQEKLLAALDTLSAEELEAKAPFSPSNNEKETLGSLLATIAFHEAYHSGQTGLLRRIAGKEGTIK